MSSFEHTTCRSYADDLHKSAFLRQTAGPDASSRLHDDATPTRAAQAALLRALEARTDAAEGTCSDLVAELHIASTRVSASMSNIFAELDLLAKQRGLDL